VVILDSNIHELFPVILLVLHLIAGFVSFIAVNTGHYYSLLYTPYCLFSWNCGVEVFLSIIAYSSLLILLLDAVFAYLFSSLLLKSGVELKRVIGSYLSGSLLLLFLESLYLISVNRVKTVILGAGGGGVLALGFLGLYMGLNAKYLVISVERNKYVAIPRTLFMVILYLLARSALSAIYTTSKISYALLGFFASGSVGCLTGVLGTRRIVREASWIEPVGLAYLVLVIGAVVATLTGSTLYAWRNYEDTVLYYVSKECEIEYNVLKGAFEGREVIKTEQKITIYPTEETSSTTQELLKGWSVSGGCRILYEQPRKYTDYSMALTLLAGGALVLLYTIAVSKQLRKLKYF